MFSSCISAPIASIVSVPDASQIFPLLLRALISPTARIDFETAAGVAEREWPASSPHLGFAARSHHFDTRDVPYRQAPGVRLDANQQPLRQQDGDSPSLMNPPCGCHASATWWLRRLHRRLDLDLPGVGRPWLPPD